MTVGTSFIRMKTTKKSYLCLRRRNRALPFFLYAYCLMTNHFHLLMERQADTIGRTMQRVLTGHSQYYNRKYHNVGHLFQGRHKAILCQSELSPNNRNIVFQLFKLVIAGQEGGLVLLCKCRSEAVGVGCFRSTRRRRRPFHVSGLRFVRFLGLNSRFCTKMVAHMPRRPRIDI